MLRIKVSGDCVLFVICQVNAETLKPCFQLLKAYVSLTTRVNSSDQLNSEAISASKPSCSFFYLIHDVSHTWLWKYFWIIFHVFLSVLIALLDLEVELVEVNCLANKKVLLGIVFSCCFILMLLSLHEFTSYSSRIFITYFIDHYSVISTKERESKYSILIIRFRRNKLALESKYVNIVLEHFLHINWRSFWLQTLNILKSILFSSYSIMWRNLMINQRFVLTSSVERLLI